MAPVGGKPKHPGKAIIAGGVSGAIEICCTYPLEFTKTVSQLDKGSGGAWGVVKNTMKTEGPLGFYRGFLPAYARIGPTILIQLPVAEALRRAFGVRQL